MNYRLYIKKIFSIKLIGKIILTYLVLEATGFPETGNDRELFKRILKNNSGIKTVDAFIDQLTIKGRGTPFHNRGRFRAGSGGRFRIDYTDPEEQLVVHNGRDLRWYFINEKLIYIYPGKDSGKVISSTPLEKYRKETGKGLSVKYMGVRFYGLFKFVDLYRLRDKKRKMDIFLWIDPGRGVLLKRVLKDREGIEYMKEEFRNYRKVSGFYFPGSVEVMARTNVGTTTSITRYSHIVINKSLSKNLFKMIIPPGTVRKIINE